jgi:hypothetical protein
MGQLCVSTDLAGTEGQAAGIRNNPTRTGWQGNLVYGYSRPPRVEMILGLLIKPLSFYGVYWHKKQKTKNKKTKKLSETVGGFTNV